MTIHISGWFTSLTDLEICALARLSQLARSGGDFAGLDVGKCESNQWGAPGSQL
jgi:hypothetical protein